MGTSDGLEQRKGLKDRREKNIKGNMAGFIILVVIYSDFAENKGFAMKYKLLQPTAQIKFILFNYPNSKVVYFGYIFC